MTRILVIAMTALLAGCSSSTTSSPEPASKAAAADRGTPGELKSLIGARGSSGEEGLKQAGYEFRNGSRTDTSSITHWRGKNGTCVAVTTTEGRYASITAVDADRCSADGSAVAESGKAGAKRTVCGLIVGGKQSRYLCEVEENRQGTTVLRFPDTTLKLTWNVGSTSVQVEQDGTTPVTVKYSDAEGETNFRVDERTLSCVPGSGPITRVRSDRSRTRGRGLARGVLYRAMGIPTNMFTVMFALGRLPGWIAHWLEQRNAPSARISRPRQIYTGATARPWVPLDERRA